MATFRMPRPQIGDVLERLSLDGLIEESMVTSIKYNKSDPNFWNVVIVTRNGFDFVSSHNDHITEHDWRPKGWVYHRQTNCFLPTGVEWSVEEKKYLYDEDPKGDDAVPDIELPTPVMGEKYMSWRARVYKAVPDLKSNPRAPEALSAVWKNRDQPSH